MSLLVAADLCTGCFACMASCPPKAIDLRYDGLGNCFPEINESKCINCRKCQRVCPEQQQLENYEPQKAYAAWSLDLDSRRSSASGGAASEFYAEALSQGYWICGAEYCTDGSVIHTLSCNGESIKRYKQSKYVYSDAHVVYPEIKSLLEQGHKVLMISLPCKIAGLLSFLGKSYSNLLTVDIVCHGTPSTKLLQKHIVDVARVSQGFSLHFRRDNQFMFCVEVENKLLYQKNGREDTYLAAFLEGLSYRDSCYQCRYAKPGRISDITICDFWGLGAEIPFEHPYTGAVSAVLLNSEKGVVFFEACKSRMFVEERPVSEAIKGNAQLNAPTPVHPKRKEFEDGCAEKGFEKTVSELLKGKMNGARRENKRNALRMQLRRCAGIFVERYRG